MRFTEWGSEGGDAKDLLAHAKGPIESAGWYQDAGDWDSYYSHLRVAQELLLAYEMAPRNFRDGELNIPESSNGVPDILDEAAWLPRFCYRLRHELLAKHYGTGGLGLRIAGDAFGEDEKTCRTARRSARAPGRTSTAPGPLGRGSLVHLPLCRRRGAPGFLPEPGRAADPEGVDWAGEAAEAYAWARKNTRPGDDSSQAPLADPRAYAAAALFRITGDKAYEKQFRDDTADITATTALWDDRQYGPVLYALGGGEGAARRGALAQDARGRAGHGRRDRRRRRRKRALRWGGNWYMPMLVGQQTTPLVLQVAVGHALSKRSDPEQAEHYLAALYTTCDYFLGCNALNMTWATGLGPRHPPRSSTWMPGTTARAIPPGHHPLRPLAQRKGPRPGTLGRRLAAQDGLSAHRRLARQRALVRQPLLADEQRVHHPPKHRPGRRDLRLPLRPGAGVGRSSRGAVDRCSASRHYSRWVLP